MELASPIAVALDAPDASTVIRISGSVRKFVGVFKIGLTAFVGEGAPLVRSLRRRRPVFLDLKLHDIPAQVEGAAAAAARLGISFLTVHASGGSDMVRAAVSGAGDVTVLGVTLLTSLSGDDLARLGISGSSEDAVVRLADIALGAGAGGLVCSPLEVGLLRRRFGSSDNGGPILVVPGIRPAGSATGDQRRTGTPKETLQAGADIIVVGRPITAAPDPAAAARALAAEIT